MSGHLVLAVENSDLHGPLIQVLAAEGYCALCFHSVEEATGYLREPDCPAFVAAFHLPMRRQSDFLAVAELSRLRPQLQILLVAQKPGPMLQSLCAGNASVQLLETPLNHPESAAVLRKALKSTDLSAPGELVGGGQSRRIGPTGHSGKGLQAAQLSSPVAAPLYSEEFLRRVGMADVPVLLSGETGVGKEVMARRLRAYSARAGKPFLKLNCAALPSELAESELFGCVKGAFTGATTDRQGRFEIAEGGTILLDEVGDMDLRLQTKLLHVLQDGEIQPLGSNRLIKVNVRVMAATHRDLTRGIEEGTFREDLYYRLNVVKIVIPPLRERKDEILSLAETLLARHLAPGMRPPAINEELKRFLLEYSWPGNVRELENVMRRFLVYQDPSLLIRELREASPVAESNGKPSKLASFPPANRVEETAPADRPDRNDRLDRLAEASRVAETELLLDALEACRWNRRQAAASLQIDYKAFLYKLQKYGIVESKGKRREVSA
jgi:two-component system response regulator AtoC